MHVRVEIVIIEKERGRNRMTYTHISVKSGYSLMESTISIPKLIQKAKQLGYKSLALTDRDVLYGAVSFYQTCIQEGIKPILGMTATIVIDEEKNCPLIFLARNDTGYRQLLKLSTYLQTNDINHLPIEAVQQHTDGLIGVLAVGPLMKIIQNNSGMQENSIFALIEEWKAIFREGDFYVGLDTSIYESSLWKTADFQYAGIQDVYYLDEKDVHAYDCLQSMRYDEKWMAKKSAFLPTGHHLTSPEEIKNQFSAWPALIDTTEEIADKCTTYLNFEEKHLPSFPVPAQINAAAYLREKCEEGLKARYTEITDKHRQRLEYELKTITEMNYSDYFLIVADFIQFAKNNQIIVGPGRGSSAGSLVAYLLGITEIDPIKYHLLFERFLNPERLTMPDIDVDFSDIRRDEVIDYVREKYGKEHVAQIITFGTFATRSVLRELIKTMDIHEADSRYILREIQPYASKKIRDILQQSEELASYVKESQQLKLLFSIAMKLEGLPRNISTHAAGVVISKHSLLNEVPLTNGTGETYLTQYAMNELEAVGLLKMDFLGLRNLSLLERVAKGVAYQERKGWSLQSIPEQDEKTFQLLQKGQTSGIFQLESAGMRKVLQELKPTSFEDIVAVNALYRPGPMDFIPVYIRRKFKEEPVTYPHPDLEPILKSTYGVLIYQEQIMQIANRIAGFRLGQADILRRAVSKKKEIVIQEQEEAFIQGCLNNGYSKAVAQEIFSWIVRFSNYGFPRSHAVAYSRISYQLAYLKAHYPEMFFAALLTDAKNQPEKLSSYQEALKKLGISILPPHINKSHRPFTVEKGAIRIGLSAIKGVSSQALTDILEKRKEARFTGFFDFCMRVDGKKVNRAVIKSLILTGAFDSFHSNRASLLASIDQALEQKELFQGMFEGIALLKEEMTYSDIDDYSTVQKLADEKELLGIYVSNHPFESYREILRANGIISLNQLTAHFAGKRQAGDIVGIVESVKVIRTKRGERMAFLTISDEDKKMDAVVFPNLFREIANQLQAEEMVWIRATVEERKQKLQLVIQEMAPLQLENVTFPETEKLFIRMTDQGKNQVLQYMKKLAQQQPGNIPVIVYNAAQRQTYRLSNDYSLHITDKVLHQLKQYFGYENVVKK